MSAEPSISRLSRLSRVSRTVFSLVPRLSPVSLSAIPYPRICALAENGGFVCVIFEFKEIARRVLKEISGMFQSCIGEPPAWLLVKLQSLGFRAIAQHLPVLPGREHQSKVPRVNSMLRFGCPFHQMGHKLMAAKTEGDGGRRGSSQFAADPVHIKSRRCLEVETWEGQMEEDGAHVQMLHEKVCACEIEWVGNPVPELETVMHHRLAGTLQISGAHARGGVANGELSCAREDQGSRGSPDT